MRKFIAALMLTAPLALTASAFAEEGMPAKQGSVLGACSKEAAAKGLKGDERNKYLSDCAKAHKTEKMEAKKSQGQKLGACSKEAAAKGLKGDDRKKFMSDCGKAA